MTRRSLADRFIRWGLHLQILFLLMVDWGTIEGIRRAEEVEWIHVIGLIVVNVILLPVSALALYWVHGEQKRRAGKQRKLGTLAQPKS